eukprot:g40484.t1
MGSYLPGARVKNVTERLKDTTCGKGKQSVVHIDTNDRGRKKLFEDVTKKIDEGRAVDNIYLDFSKAFDKVLYGTLELPTYAHGTTNAFHLLQDFQFPGLQNLIFTMDIQSLYTCIPHADGLKALCFFLSRRPNQSPSTDTLICLTELVLTLNSFSFNSSHFLQSKGVAMSTCMCPNHACLFVRYVEQFLFRCYTDTIPHLFLCYIDDCIGIASCSHAELEQFINFTNTFHSNLKFTWTISDTSIPFLGLSVSISGNRLNTDIYSKPN